MPTTKLNNIDLYYEVHGKGQPLMLIAGLASDCRSWQTVLRPLAEKYQLILPDNRGVGRTAPQDEHMTVEQITDDCVALARHLGIERMDVLGHSMGGIAAMDMAMRYPDMVQNLVLAATVSSISRRNALLFRDWADSRLAGGDLSRWFRSVFYWLFTPTFFENQGQVEIAVQYALEDPYPQSGIAFANQIRAILNMAPREVLSDIKARTLVIAGELDLIFPTDAVEKLADAIPCADYVEIVGAAHSVHVEQAQAFIESVTDFLASS